ncbi:MAG: hypothetical protein V7752_09350 [Halopseudomonas sp.]
MRVLLAVWLLVCSVVHAAPPPGHPTTDQAAEIMGIDATAEMPNRGQVIEVIDSNSYTYIQVQVSDQQRLWLAAPRLVLVLGQYIDYPQGVVMRNFYSKKLQRTFDQVWFVSGVRLVP